MQGAKPVDSLMDPNSKLLADEGELLDYVGQYRGLIGKLFYFTLTRLDISFAINVVSQFMQASRKPHLDVVIRILRYLKGSSG